MIKATLKVRHKKVFFVGLTDDDIATLRSTHPLTFDMEGAKDAEIMLAWGATEEEIYDGLQQVINHGGRVVKEYVNGNNN